jgi:methylthioribulose-1-phosphate dehydratase
MPVAAAEPRLGDPTGHVAEATARDRSTSTLIAELCQQFYALGWVSGTGGGISIRDAEGVWMAPSGVQKERIDPADVWLLADGVWDRVEVLERPRDAALRLSECQPLFFNAYRMRDAGAVLHSHSLWAVLAARLARATGLSEFRSKNLEMQKGLRGIGCFDELRVPIIPNTPRESQLTQSMAEAIAAYPDVDAVIVEGHGVYVWGADWAQAKTQAECLDYLMRAAVEAHRIGLPLD